MAESEPILNVPRAVVWAAAVMIVIQVVRGLLPGRDRHHGSPVFGLHSRPLQRGGGRTARRLSHRGHLIRDLHGGAWRLDASPGQRVVDARLRDGRGPADRHARLLRIFDPVRNCRRADPPCLSLGRNGPRGGGIGGHFRTDGRRAAVHFLRPSGTGRRWPQIFRAPPWPISARPCAITGSSDFSYFWLVLNAYFGLTSVSFAGASDGIAWEAHIGGFLCGLLTFGLFDRSSVSENASQLR